MKSIHFANNPRLYILIISILFLSPIYGQSNKFKPEWNVGITGGENLSYVDFDPHIKTKFLTGSTFGLSFRYLSENHFGLIGEVNYSQQGWRQDFVEYDSIYAYSRSVNYITIPVMTHIYFGKKVRYVFNFGPKVSFKINDKEKMNTALSELLASGDTTTLSITEEYGKDIEKGFDYGLEIGTGVEFRTGIGNFMLEGRYYFGLNDIFNSNASDYFSRSAYRSVSVKLTYLINAF